MIQQAPGCNVAPFGLYLFLFITSGKYNYRTFPLLLAEPNL